MHLFWSSGDSQGREETYELAFANLDGRYSLAGSKDDRRSQRNHVILHSFSDLRGFSHRRQKPGSRFTVLGIDGFIRNVSMTTAFRYGNVSICSKGRPSP